MSDLSVDRPIHRAVVLAAGKGKRMGELATDIPKPMLPVHGKPMLAHILQRLSEAGLTEFLLIVGHGRDSIQRYFARWPAPIQFCVQEPVNGTGSAALLARNFTANQPFLLTYGDILVDPGEYARSGAVLASDSKISAVLAVKAVDDPWQGAAVYEENGRIQRIIEKPPRGSSLTHWNSAGFYVFRPILFEYLDRVTPSSRGEYELTSALDLMLDAGLDLRISSVEGDWRDVGRPEDLAAVNAD
ncbi:MAG: NTP transferase domain-containing protein [Acidobacteriaceae bacterium]|nr:NTP transferase domain-containing protein [Acidobacteriaceae bacterium]MBV9501223.1 NTP transferase domain-containing protein [Acidobacteriaceae bacterium]